MADDPKARAVRLVVDRREGDIVVVEIDGAGTVDLPGWLLPPAVAEGDVLEARVGPLGKGGWRVDVQPNAEETRAAHTRARDVHSRLRGRDPGGTVDL